MERTAAYRRLGKEVSYPPISHRRCRPAAKNPPEHREKGYSASAPPCGVHQSWLSPPAVPEDQNGPRLLILRPQRVVPGKHVPFPFLFCFFLAKSMSDGARGELAAGFCHGARLAPRA